MLQSVTMHGYSSAACLLILFYGEFRLRNAPIEKTVKVTASSSSYDVRRIFREALKGGEYPPLAVNMAMFDEFMGNTAVPGQRSCSGRNMR